MLSGRKRFLTGVDGQVDVAALCVQLVGGGAAVQTGRLGGDVGDLHPAGHVSCWGGFSISIALFPSPPPPPLYTGPTIWCYGPAHL